MYRLIPFVIAIFSGLIGFSQGSFQIALLKYNGGGDWYANPTSLPNLIAFANRNLNAGIAEESATIDAADPQIFNYPFIHMTGHGNVVFSTVEISLRTSRSFRRAALGATAGGRPAGIGAFLRAAACTAARALGGAVNSSS